MDTTVPNILAKLADGLLPNQAPTKCWGGYGSRDPCDGCAEPILSGEVEHELDFDGHPTVRFHVACEAIWRALSSQITDQVADPPLHP